MLEIGFANYTEEGWTSLMF